MSSTEVYQLNLGPITAHAFNKDRTQVAICPNNNEVQIYKKAGKDWNLIHTLAEHDKLITSIDWAPESNRLVTSSQDRNTYVWNLYETGEWKPTLVLLRIDRAATFVRWSPNEDKFAVASGARVIAICFFDEENDWWTSKHLKKPIRSTVLSLDWHPNNTLLASGSADFKARVISAFIKGVDKRPPPTAWGEKFPFNTVLGEFSNGGGGWIHSVAFSPSGEALAFAGHDSEISIVYPGGAIKSIRLTGLPYLSLLWTSEEKIIAAGYDCAPVLFEKTNEEWNLSRIIDAGKKKVVGESTAFNRFRDWDSKGISSRGGNEDSGLNTIHQNTITSIRHYAGTRENVTHFSTSGLDGKLVVWDLESLESQFRNLKV
uniref:Actin-related protein 2/3 complex subunit n=1 Tax=Anthurium amnicola TaxID=1678845 RepID=A0A1D1YN76_9ARAE